MERGELGGWILRKGPGKVDDDKGGHGSFLQTMINTLAAALSDLHLKLFACV